MPRPALLRLLPALILAATLPACGGEFRRTVGLDAPPPDEFLVVSRRPLAMPSDLETLPPPQPGAPSRVDPDPSAQAQGALAGRPASRPAAPSPGEAALAARVGEAEPDIRERTTAELPAPQRRFLFDSLFGYEFEQDPGVADERLDPAEEARRLREQGVAAPTPPEPAEE